MIAEFHSYLFHASSNFWLEGLNATLFTYLLLWRTDFFSPTSYPGRRLTLVFSGL